MIDQDVRPVLAFVSAGDITTPSAFSGIPFNLAAALEKLGVEVIPVVGRPPRTLERALAASTYLRWSLAVRRGPPRRSLASAHNGIATTRARTAVARRSLQTHRVDGIVQIGSEFLISSRVPVATYEDKTIVQEINRGDEEWLRVPSRDRMWRVARQRAAYHRASVCCTLSNWAARSIRDDYGIEAAKIKVLGAGANQNSQLLPRDWSRPVFLFVGRDWGRKNGGSVVAAFCALREEVPEARLHVVGNHPPLDGEGVTGHGCLDMSDANGRKSLNRLFSCATCFVLPSSHEPLGIAFIEAAAAGVPSIGTTRDGSPEAVGPGGRIIDPDRPEELLAAMRELCDPATASALGREALLHSRLYTWRNVAERLLLALDVRPQGARLTARFLNDCRA